jgi:predicted nucleic-acid-binding protein
MILIDTNVLLRVLLQDDPQQHKEALASLRRLERAGKKALVCQVVLAELVWVLGRLKKVPRETLAQMLHGLSSMDVLEFEQRSRMLSALAIYENHSVDFADALLAAAAAEKGHNGVLSFDRDMGKLGVAWVKP